MKVDPNQPVEFQAVCVLFESGQAILHDGLSTPKVDLNRESSPFQKFCRSLDPNKSYIHAIIPDEADNQVFFEARKIANEIGIHMQALIDTPENHRRLWEDYKKMKGYATIEEHES